MGKKIDLLINKKNSNKQIEKMYFSNLADATKKAKVYKALRNWIQYRKWAEKKYTIYCMIHDMCIYCNEPLDTKKFCETCEPDLHDLYYMRERNLGLKIRLRF